MVGSCRMKGGGGQICSLWQCGKTRQAVGRRQRGEIGTRLVCRRIGKVSMHKGGWEGGWVASSRLPHKKDRRNWEGSAAAVVT